MANQLRNLPWNFETPNVNALFQPIQQGLRDYRQQQQLGIENARADKQIGFQQQRLDMDRQRFDDDKAQKVRERAGNLALLALQEPDEGRRTQRWQQFLSTHPNAAGLDPKYHDPRTGPLAVLADAGMAQQYLDHQMKRAADARAATAANQATAMHGPQLETARVQAQTARRDFEEPRATADLNAGHNRVIYNPRTGAPVQTIQGPPKPPDATDRKAGWEAEDEMPNLKSAIEQLTEARALLPKIYTGYGAGARSSFNQAAPGFLPNVITDPARAQATQRYNQILGTESIAAMSQTLKGATTDFEMREFSRLMNDPNQSPETKQLALNAMLSKAQNHYAVKAARLKELGRSVPSGAGGTPPQGGGWSIRRID